MPREKPKVYERASGSEKPMCYERAGNSEKPKRNERADRPVQGWC